VDGAEVGVVEEVDEEGFGSFLEGDDGLTLPSVGAVFGCDCLRDLADLEARELTVKRVYGCGSLPGAGMGALGAAGRSTSGSA